MSLSRPPRALHHVAIQVHDLEVSRAFYVDVLGFTLVRTQAHALWVSCGGTLLMLERVAGGIQQIEPAPWKSDALGPHLIAFLIDSGEREAWRAHLVAHGVTVVHETAFTLYVKDPDGTRLGFSHYPVTG